MPDDLKRAHHQSNTNLFKKLVQDRLDSGKKIDDFIGLMTHHLSKTFTGEDLINETASHVALAISGAFFTTAPAMHYLLVELARRPDVANKVQEEIDRVVGDGVPTYEQLKKMDYCSAVIKESQRINTNIFQVGRQAVADTSLGEYFIPQGSGILITVSQIHRHPNYWKDPDTFNPERFLDKPMGQDHLFAYIPFGAGKRACIARHFTPLEMLMALILIMRNYNLELPTDEPIKDQLFGAFLLLRPLEEHLVIRKI